MFNHLFGNYLVKINRITEEQLNEILESEGKVRVKLGLIAVSEKLMTTVQADEVNRLQAVMDKRFGDIAVSKGYLTSEQVGRLLGLQGNAYLVFAQTLTEKGYMTLQDIEQALSEYQKVNGLTNTDIEALKSGDNERIVPIFLPTFENVLEEELIGIAIRTLARLVWSEVYMDKAYITDSVNVKKAAGQNLEGDYKIGLAFAGDGDSLLTIADKFAGESFDKVDMDVLDAVGEFVNCINGMFATASSYKKVSIDMAPPMFCDREKDISGKAICVVPLHIFNKKVDMLVTFKEGLSL